MAISFKKFLKKEVERQPDAHSVFVEDFLDGLEDPEFAQEYCYCSPVESMTFGGIMEHLPLDVRG